MLELRSVRFAFGKAPVLDDLSMKVGTGALIGLLGPNGSGKTTLLKLISRGLTPDAGRILFEGTDISTRSRGHLARRMAVVPQDTHLAFDYTALEIVLMGRYPHLGPFEIEGPADLEIARQAMRQTGTEEFGGRAFRTLSGGEKQRVVIASALAQLEQAPHMASPAALAAPALLLLDEPTSSLDLRYQLEVAALLTRLHETGRLTIVVSTHDLRFAESICTEVVLLSGGRVLAQGTPAEVLTPELVGAVYGIDAAVAAPLIGRR
jgi:iron complex transport system ATP-binding protein